MSKKIDNRCLFFFSKINGKLIKGNIDESSLVACIYCANALPPLGILLGCPRLPFVLLTTHSVMHVYRYINRAFTAIHLYTDIYIYDIYTRSRSISLTSAHENTQENTCFLTFFSIPLHLFRVHFFFLLINNYSIKLELLFN